MPPSISGVAVDEGLRRRTQLYVDNFIADDVSLASRPTQLTQKVNCTMMLGRVIMYADTGPSLGTRAVVDVLVNRVQEVRTRMDALTNKLDSASSTKSEQTRFGILESKSVSFMRPFEDD